MSLIRKSVNGKVFQSQKKPHSELIPSEYHHLQNFVKLQHRKQTGLSVSLKISGLSNAEILLTAFVQSTAYCSVISWFITMVST